MAIFTVTFSVFSGALGLNNWLRQKFQEFTWSKSKSQELVELDSLQPLQIPSCIMCFQAH